MLSRLLIPLLITSSVFIGSVFTSSVFISTSDGLLLAEAPPTDLDKSDSIKTDRAERLSDYLTNKKFVGQFTVDGKDAPPKTEGYLISKCEKLETQDMYRLTARIRYGDTDHEAPLEVKILFAGETPVITLDEFWIPGLGTFDARVVIRRNRYAGTWQHGEQGGHLFGKIEPSAPSEPPQDLPSSTDQE